MNFLLDTNAVSAWKRPKPDTGLVRWLTAVDEDCVFLSVITLAELRRGVEMMPPGARRDLFDAWLVQDVTDRFSSRLLPVDAEIADLWGRVMMRGRSVGRPTSPMDAFIAATAERHDLTLVTRNTSDFDALGIRLLNPWTGF